MNNKTQAKGKKDKVLNIRVASDIYFDIYQAAEELGVTVSEFARSAIEREANNVIFGADSDAGTE